MLQKGNIKSYKITYHNIFGGGKTTAKATFNKYLNNEQSKLDALVNSDEILQQKLRESNISPKINNSEVIFDIIVEGLHEKIIDSFIIMYLKKEMGRGLEDKGRFIDSYEKVIMLRNNKKALEESDSKEIVIPTTFTSLIELEDFISKNEHNLTKIDEKKRKKNQNKIDQKTIVEEGKDDIDIVFENEKVIIYKPTSEAGSKCYGKGTRWCTAGKSNNMFNHYNEQGPLFIIQTKQTTPKRKFQLHIETESLMDEKDEPVNINEINEILDNDERFKDWFNELLLSKINFVDKRLWLEFWIPTFKEEHSYLEEVFFNDSFNQPLGNSLDNLTNLHKLKFGYKFNQPLGNSLDKLINLQELEFGFKFNKPLGNSLDNLTNLQELTFGRKFDRNLDTSLYKLANLRELTFGSGFNQPLGNSLDNLTNLQVLTFGEKFNQPLGNSLDNLTNLHQLKFGKKFNQPLDDSLNRLTNLQQLNFGDEFNKSFGESLDKLTSLKHLFFYGSYNIDLLRTKYPKLNIRQFFI